MKVEKRNANLCGYSAVWYRLLSMTRAKAALTYLDLSHRRAVVLGCLGWAVLVLNRERWLCLRGVSRHLSETISRDLSADCHWLGKM